jgi:hypothetical protein
MAYVQYAPETEMGKELARWNKPYRFEMFPKMVYRAKRMPNGKYSAGIGDDSELGGKPGAAEQFSSACQQIVKDEFEYTRAKENGWRDSQGEAVEYAEQREDKLAKEAAHRAHDDRNMGEKAKEEVKAAEAESFEHVAEVPEQPKKRRGRPPKNAAA